MHVYLASESRDNFPVLVFFTIIQTLQASKDLSAKETKKERREATRTITPQCDPKLQKYVNSDILKHYLTRDNYKEKFHQLISLEEKEHEIILKEK